MQLLYFMLPFMLSLGAVLVILLIWAIRADQFEDMEGEKHRIFFEGKPRN